jgi:hypothetical protein
MIFWAARKTWGYFSINLAINARAGLHLSLGEEVTGVQTKKNTIRQHKTQPIDQYLGRLYGKEKRIDGYERYYSPNPEKTVSVLSHYGFNIKFT